MANSTIMDIEKYFRPDQWHTSETYQSRLTDNSIKWTKVGNVVFVSGRAKTALAFTAGGAMATGFPTPAFNTSVPLSGCASNGTANAPMSINASGSLCTIGALSNNTYYAVAGVYFTGQ